MITRLNKAIAFFCSLLALPLIASTFASAMLRYVFRTPNMWLWFFSIWFYGISFSLGGAYLLHINGHTSVDAVFRLLPHKLKASLRAINTVLILTTCSIVLTNAVGQAWYSTITYEIDSSVLEVSPPIWWYKWVLAASFALVVLQASALLWQTLRERVRRPLSRGA